MGTPVQVRFQPTELAPIDNWIAQQPVPQPSRPEAIRRLLTEALQSHQPVKTTDQKIASAKRQIADNPAKGDPSPAKGMATLRRGLAETKLRSLKGLRRGQRKTTEGD